MSCSRGSRSSRAVRSTSRVDEWPRTARAPPAYTRPRTRRCPWKATGIGWGHLYQLALNSRAGGPTTSLSRQGPDGASLSIPNAVRMASDRRRRTDPCERKPRPHRSVGEKFAGASQPTGRADSSGSVNPHSSRVLAAVAPVRASRAVGSNRACTGGRGEPREWIRSGAHTLISKGPTHTTYLIVHRRDPILETVVLEPEPAVPPQLPEPTPNTPTSKPAPAYATDIDSTRDPAPQLPLPAAVTPPREEVPPGCGLAAFLFALIIVFGALAVTVDK